MMKNIKQVLDDTQSEHNLDEIDSFISKLEIEQKKLSKIEFSTKKLKHVTLCSSHGYPESET